MYCGLKNDCRYFVSQSFKKMQEGWRCLLLLLLLYSVSKSSFWVSVWLHFSIMKGVPVFFGSLINCMYKDCVQLNIYRQ